VLQPRDTDFSHYIMGREHEEDGAKTKPKHITFEEVSLDGSDEDEGAVEVSAMSFNCFVVLNRCLLNEILFFVCDSLPLTIWYIRLPLTRGIHTGEKAHLSHRRLLRLLRSVCHRADVLSVSFIN
jgi:hypothetical protein